MFWKKSNTRKDRFGTELTAAVLSSLAGVAGALAFSCCAGPVLLVALGIGSAGMTHLQSLAPFRPLFIVLSLGTLLFAFRNVYLSKAQACEDNCETPQRIRLKQILLWIATVMVLASIAAPYILDRIMLRP